ncbi:MULTISPECIES: FHA domain-containing protein [Nostocales]|uniref:FHA domain-containing protein n=3 Tax=Nostocales TaxID=1161 RepID=A0A0C1MY73_9CYAN|nr:FHA domain-containing protein [Tolypothrix bouteillei]KAF3889245.1 FHA domain-containing protein [Tolypothrix bouteillei VB521301]
MKVKVFNSQTKNRGIELDFDEIFTDEDVCIIGRSPDSGLVLDSSDISRVHGKFFRENGEIYYVDLGSTNGSKVNDEIVTMNQNYLLKSGDVIQAGEFVLFIQETSNIPEDKTVVRDLDATVFSSWKPEVQATDSPGALVRVSATLETEEPDDPKSQTQALLAAINKRIVKDVTTTKNWTRDSYINAVRKARETIEHSKIIDPEALEKEADKYWRSLSKGASTVTSRLGSATIKGASEIGSRLSSATVKGASEIGNRLGSAAKAAWKEAIAPKSSLEKELTESRSENKSDVFEAADSEEKHLQTVEDEMSQLISGNNLHTTASEDNSHQNK